MGAVAWLATKPKLVLPPAATCEFQSADFIDASDPDCDNVPFQELTTASPLASTQPTVHLLIGFFDGLVTVTCAWNPPVQVLVTEYVAWHVVAGGGGEPPAPIPVT